MTDIHFADLPRRDPFVSFYSQVAKSVAGCFVCQRPIAKGTHRISVVIRLPEPRVSPDGTVRKTERFNAHAGCLVSGLEDEGVTLTTGWDCWDCGAEPEFRQGHPWKCFTTTRFAPGALCTRCAQRARWRACESCVMFYPHYMVSAVSDGGDLQLTMDVCEYCAARQGVKTVLQIKREADEFEALRQRMAAGKVFPK